jgi:hypothetical protein
VKNKNAFRRTVLLGGILMVLSICTAGLASAAAFDEHPELDEQDMFISCADCHKDATPEVEKQWHESVHGIAMVKCYQCHGTFETFRVNPGVENCATCHANQLDKKIAQDKLCWECHVPHSFKAEK